MWDLHDRLDDHVTEENCRAEISSFSKHGQLVAALGRAVNDNSDCDIELICGARRLFAARHLNMPLLVELREMSDQMAIIAMDIENRQRKDISPYERGLSFARYLRAGHFKSQDDLAQALKISQSQVSRLLTLAHLPSVVVNAFRTPLDIREGWGHDLMTALQNSQRRRATIDRARTLASLSPRPAAIDAYQQLLTASVKGRKVKAKQHDEVVRGAGGTPIFRIRVQEKTIAFLFPLDSVSTKTLETIRDAIRNVFEP